MSLLAFPASRWHEHLRADVLSQHESDIELIRILSSEI